MDDGTQLRRTGRTTGIGLRILGLALLCIAALALRTLGATRATSHDAIAVMLAAVGFVGGSLGTTLALLGPHVSDPVEVSAKWAKPPRSAATVL